MCKKLLTKTEPASTATASSEESTCTIPKQQRLEVEDSFSDSGDIEIFLD